MSLPKGPPEGSSICIGCGLCCDGTLHGHADVRRDDESAVRAVGLALTDHDGKTVFSQPCPKFDCGRCTIYNQRPAVCRAYRCKLLKNVHEGRTSVADAHEKIAAAKAIIARIRSFSEDAITPVQRGALWGRLRCETGHTDDEEGVRRARAILDLVALDYLLEQHFRRKSRTEGEDPAA